MLPRAMKMQRFTVSRLWKNLRLRRQNLCKSKMKMFTATKCWTRKASGQLQHRAQRLLLHRVQLWQLQVHCLVSHMRWSQFLSRCLRQLCQPCNQSCWTPRQRQLSWSTLSWTATGSTYCTAWNRWPQLPNQISVWSQNQKNSQIQASKRKKYLQCHRSCSTALLDLPNLAILKILSTRGSTAISLLSKKTAWRRRLKSRCRSSRLLWTKSQSLKSWSLRHHPITKLILSYFLQRRQ